MNWGKVQNVGVRVLVPLVTAIITYVVATANANREFKAKMIEDAIRVLAAPVCDSTRTYSSGRQPCSDVILTCRSMLGRNPC